jgi:RecB family exonuclease
VNEAGPLYVVPSERHVERWTREGRRVETRDRLRARLFDELVRDRSLATPTEARMALAQVLPAIAARHDALASVVRGSAAAWESTLDALDGAIGALRLAAVAPATLRRVATAGQGGRRAQLLVEAWEAVDAHLEARALVDPRSAGVVLADRLPAQPPGRVAGVVGAGRVVARFVLAWDGGDVAWWRALDAALVRAGGEGARVELPSFDERLDAERERGPLDIVSEEVARATDAAPVGVVIDAPLGDLRLLGAVPEGPRHRLESRAAVDAAAQARAVLDAVRHALQGGSGVEDIAITAGLFDEPTVVALRQAFDDARIPLHDVRGESPARAGVVKLALGALGLADGGLGRIPVAALARSRYIDPERLGATTDTLHDLAYALERTPTALTGETAAALEATARASVVALATGRRTPDEENALGEARAALAATIAAAVLPCALPATRLAHVAAARALFVRLGVDPLRGSSSRAVLSTDEPPRDIARAELGAAARDAHAWDILEAALSDYEAATARLGLGEAVVAPRTFRHELARALDARAGRPPAARAGAVRIAELGDLAAERLGLLVVVDANDGALPGRSGGEPLLHPTLTTALRTADPVYAPPSSMTRGARELTALALAASNAQAIVFTRRAIDADGASLAAAPIVAWLEKGGVATSSWRASPLDGPAVTAREAALRRVGRRGAPADVQRRARVERTREARFEVASPPTDPILGDLDSARLPPEVLAALTAETGGTARPLAVTNLERFATCPFQGFAAQVLLARRQRPLRELPDRRETGTLLHRALAAAFTATAPLWAARPRDADRIHAGASEAANAVLRDESVASPLRRLALGRVRDAVRAVVRSSLADEAWDFALAEQPFGDGRAGGWAPLVLEEDGARLALRGTIDRVDLGHGRAAVRVLDYKSTPRAAESGMRALGETAFQVALYARAAADALSALERAGGYLGATRPDDVGPKVKRDYEARWEALHVETGGLTVVERAAIDVVRRVRLGGIAPRPRDEAACALCDSSGGCRKPRFAIQREDDEGGGAT